MRWEYRSPEEKLFLADGKTTWLYIPAEKQARKSALKNLEDVRSPLAFLLGKTKLQELGFDCSVAPSDPKAESFYARQIPRTGFVALEYDGAAWQSWLESYRQGTLTRPGPAGDLDIVRRTSSRLVVIDAAHSAGPESFASGRSR